VVCVAHGWTAATWKVRAYEMLDRLVMRRADCTVCVSEAMAGKVRRAGVRSDRIVVIRNAIRTEPFEDPDPAYCQVLRSFFPREPARIVIAAGRLSPEKGFEQFVEAAALIAHDDADVGFVLCGDGPGRSLIEDRIAARNLQGRFVLAGFRSDLERLLPHADLVVNSSYTEGLPVIVLEALAAGVPVVATAVGGTPEVIDDGVHGYLVPPGDPAVLAQRIGEVLRSDADRRAMGAHGRQRIREQFTFGVQSEKYQQLFELLTASRWRVAGSA
jgi:glycosyltransferase involved in cell wall biosynthesis